MSGGGGDVTDWAPRPHYLMSAEPCMAVMLGMRSEVVGVVAGLSVAVVAVIWALAWSSVAQQMLLRRGGGRKCERCMIVLLGSGAICSGNGVLVEAEQSWIIGGGLGR